MDELENLPVGNEESPQGSEGEPQANPSEGQPPIDDQINLETDKRWNDSFQKDPAKVLKSYYSLEKEYLPTKQLLKESGYSDLESLKKSLSEYKEFKNPDAEYNKFLSYISPMLQNENYSGTLRDSLMKIQKQMDHDKYGSQLSDEELTRIKSGEEAKEELKTLRFEMDKSQAKTEILSGLDKIEADAKEQNLNFDRNEFLKYCDENNIPPRLYKIAFDAHLKGIIKDQTIKTTEENVLKNINKTGQSVIGAGQKGASPQGESLNLDTEMDKILAS